MKTRFIVFKTVTAMICLLAFSAGVLAAAPPDACGGGTEPPDFGDLVILYRDANGVPILDGNQCQQPIAFPSETCLLECAEGEPCLVPVDPDTCAVQIGFETCTQEVDFGRINSVRSPPSVFDSQMEDVVFTLTTADCITLDPAGRLVASSVIGDEVSTSTIDSPLQNMAIYRQLMTVGYLGADAAQLVLPWATLDTAARGVGVASDKTGEVNVDLLVYVNQMLGLSDLETTYLGAPICINVKEEVKGVVQLVEKCFLNYGAYGYNRTVNFGALPDPAYIPTDAPLAGWFEYLDLYAEAADPVPTLFFINQGPIMDAVFADEPGFTDGNIGGFAQAADDTRAVIDFMHSNPIPLGYETSLTCLDSGETVYDVSISDVSGLQVPVNMVAGTEREFTVAVANAGPDEASGIVTVTAVDTDGFSIPTFPRSFDFTLVGGTSQSWTEVFGIDYLTTITWTATAEAEFDVIPGNNSVTETTVVDNIVDPPEPPDEVDLDMQLASLTGLPSKVFGTNRTLTMVATACNLDAVANASGNITLVGIDSLGSPPVTFAPQAFTDLAAGTCANATFVWTAPLQAMRIRFTAEVTLTSGVDTNPSNDTLTSIQVVVFPR
jgi:hypothetical protein